MVILAVSLYNNSKKQIQSLMEKKYLNIDELSSYIYKSKSWIYKKVGTNEIPFIKLGNRILFEITEIDHWVKNDYVHDEIHLPNI